MAKKKYAKLKALMLEQDVRQVDLEPIIGHKIAYITTRMNGHAPWNTAEMKAIGEYLGIPKDEWLDYFMEEVPPKNNRSGMDNRLSLTSKFIKKSA